MSPNERIERYLDRVCQSIRWPPYRARVRRELTDHIRSHAEYLHDERGFTEAEAVIQAIAAMGDPEALGHALQQIFPFGLRLLCAAITGLLWACILFCTIYLILFLFF